MTQSAFLNSLPHEMDLADKEWLATFYQSMPATLQKLVDQAAQITAASEDTIEKSKRLIDHTSLKEGNTPMTGTETPGEIEKLCREASESGTAAICLYPNQLEHAGHKNPAVVNNFPHGDQSAKKAAADAARAIELGGKEIDTVMDYAAMHTGDIETVHDKLRAVKQICDTGNIPLKIIVKAGTYPAYKGLREATLAACMHEPAFVKNGTGKKPKDGYGTGAPDSANLLIAATMLDTVTHYNKENDAAIGFKNAGGAKYPVDCERLRFLVENIRGAEFFTPVHTRIGASSLLRNLNPKPGANSKSEVDTAKPAPGY